MVHSYSMKSNSVFVSEDTLTSVGEGCINFLALRDKSDKERVSIEEQTVNGKAALTTFVLNSVPCKINVKLRNFWLNL